MSVCASGASQAKPGVAPVVIITSTFLAANLPTSLLWLTDYIAGSAALVNIDIPNFCTIDPPADPGLSGTDLVEIVLLGNSNPDPGPMQRLDQLIERAIWPVLCECTSGTTPTPTVPGSPPSGAPQVNPTAVLSPALVSPCLSYTGTPGAIDYSAAGVHTSIIGTVSSVGAALVSQPIPVGATSVVVKYTRTGFSGSSGGTTANLNVTDRAGTYSTLTFSNQNQTVGNGVVTQVVSVGATLATFVAEAHSNSVVPANTGTIDMDVTFYCGGANAGQAAVPCCPPDPTSTGLLQSILNIVTLIQRQAVPFATIHGAAHTGLSGNGSISVSGLIGLVVDVTSLPSRAGVTSGDPNTVFDIGWVNIGTADGFGPRHFITSDPFLLEPVAGDATVIGYSIPSDVTVTITELVREP